MRGILIDATTFAPIVEHGTLATGNTSEQTRHLMLATAKGEWKEDVRIGADARSMLGAPSDPFWYQEVRKQARILGVEIEKVTVTDGTINIS